MKKLISLSFIPAHQDVGLLLMRLWLGLSLFAKHGWEKPTRFSEMAAHFPDPIGIGAVPSLVIALVADAVCSLLVAIGLATRPAALFTALNILVAWGLVHHFEFFGHSADHGEVCFLYIGGYLALFLMGPGRFSVDAKLLPVAQSEE